MLKIFRPQPIRGVLELYPMRISLPVCAGAAATAAVLTMAVVPARTVAWPPFLTAWETKYPTSTLPQRMAALTGSSCNVCHTPPAQWLDGTCYRLAIREHIWNNLTIEQALDLVHDADPDGDGIPSGVEILTVRADDPTQIGYHPGLIGSSGTDPCANDPNRIVTGQNETPAPTCYPNCDDSSVQPVLNVDDFTCFINEYAVASALPYAQQVTHYANCDRSTVAPVLNVDDFTCFINQYALGCR